MRYDVRISGTARRRLEELDDDDAWFEAWNELRRIQNGEGAFHCLAGQFVNHWCASGRIGFRVSRSEPRVLLIWRVLEP